MQLDTALTAVRRTVAPYGYPVRVVLAIVASMVGNAALLAIALALSVAPGFMALAYPPVLFLTVVGAAGAALVYWVLTTRVENPDRTFKRIVVAVLALSFIPDFGLLVADEAATLAGVIVLMLMHVVVAVACVALLPAGQIVPSPEPEAESEPR
ncbi:DUF6069 family protein [Haloarchaeobius amylolyticus]|uniref:DUF6069 family protein n=1 Tax=Haloarchaeobius amylolyticus TaxID=1198296 RepID=UPI00226DF656|nr:DUF6069 family protein [Haloarchaeobius amylolyticus]